MLSSGSVLLHDNARPHTAAATKKLLQHELSSLLFLSLSSYETVVGGHFGTDNVLLTSIENWLKAHVAGFYDEGIGKSVPLYEKCVRRSGDYVEK